MKEQNHRRANDRATLIRWHLGFWMVAIGMVFSVYDFGSIAFKSPYGMHQWRQCDAYSVALHYAQEDRQFFEPAMHFQHGLAGGSAVGEFPMTYYLNAHAWKIVGIVPWTMKWMHLGLLLLGCWALFDALNLRFSPRSALVITAFTMGSGVMAYYGPNYLVNAAAVGLAFMGWWFGLQWLVRDGRHRGYAVGMVVALSLSVLFRPTMVLAWIPLLLALPMIKRPIRWAAMLATPLALGAAWVVWAKGVNAANESVYYLTSIRPVWSSEDPSLIWRAFREDVFPQWYHPIVAGFGGVVLLWTAVKTQNHDVKSSWLTRAAWAMVAGAWVYLVLWFENLNVHDYYLLEWQLVVPVAAAWIADRWTGKFNRVSRQWLWGVVWVMLVLQLATAGVRTRMKHRPVGGAIAEWLVPQRERDIWSWFHWDQQARFSNVSEWEKTLRALGIARTDLVISVPDPSPNITLSLMDQRGFTDLYDDEFKGDDRIEYYVSKGAKYLICNDPQWHEVHRDSPWLTQEMTQLGNFRVFNLLDSDATLRSREQPLNSTSIP